MREAGMLGESDVEGVIVSILACALSATFLGAMIIGVVKIATGT
jgi:hypothetical protein